MHAALFLGKEKEKKESHDPPCRAVRRGADELQLVHWLGEHRRNTVCTSSGLPGLVASASFSPLACHPRDRVQRSRRAVPWWPHPECGVPVPPMLSMYVHTYLVLCYDRQSLQNALDPVVRKRTCICFDADEPLCGPFWKYVYIQSGNGEAGGPRSGSLTFGLAACSSDVCHKKNVYCSR